MSHLFSRVASTMSAAYTRAPYVFVGGATGIAVLVSLSLFSKRAHAAPSSKKPKIVFLGAGLVGSDVINEVSKKLPEAQLVVVDEKTFFENNMGAVRSVTLPSFWQRTIKPHAKWLPSKAEFVLGRASELDTNKFVTVTESDGGQRRITFDYLVIQTGSRYNAFKTTADQNTIEKRGAAIKEWSDKIKAASSVLIVGGGPVGTETAAEILDQHPGKKVALVESHDRLVHHMPEGASSRVLDVLKKLGTQVILKDRVVLSDRKSGIVEGKATYKTESGKSVDADLLIDAAGPRPNTEFMQKQFASVLDKSSRIKVTDTFNVVGRDDIFAVGDAAAAGPMLAFHGMKHAPIVAHNLQAAVDGLPSSSKKRFTAPTAAFAPITTVGPKVGIFMFSAFGGVAFRADFMAKVKTNNVMTKVPADAAKS